MCVLIFGSVFFLTGCSRKATGFENTSLSPNGLMAEDFLPKDVMMVFSMNAFSNDEKDRLTALRALFPSKNMPVSEDLQSAFQKQFEALQLSYDDDVKPILGESNRIVFAFSSSNTPQSSNYVSFVIRDAEKFSALVAKLKAQQGFIEESYKKGGVIGKGTTYMAYSQDVAVLTSNIDEAKKSLDRLESKENLRRDSAYLDTMGQFDEDYFGSLYLNVPAFFASSSSSALSRAPFDYKALLGKSPLIDSILGYGFILQAEKDGYKVRGYVLGDKKRMKKNDQNFQEYQGNGSYFTQDISGQNLIFYNEGADLKRDFEVAALQWEKESSGKFSYANFKQSFQQWMKLDFDKDVLSWASNPYLFAAYQNDQSVIPGFVFIADASDNVESAQNVAKTFGLQISSVLNLVKLQYPFLSSAMEVGEMKVKNESVNVVTLDFNKLQNTSQSGEQNVLPFPVPEFLKNEKVVLTFGVVGKHFVVSTYKDFPKVYESPVLSADKEYSQIQSLVDADSGEVVYVRILEAVNYIDYMVKFFESLAGERAQNIETSYNELRPYLLPLQSFFFVTNASDYSVNMEGFVRVGSF
ncbi:DUF3352 domain-containing protein [Candidatus Peregrinibacteria bacterium]|nr:DUF3352 domain-containing protein [Candidatus Peregrinibacteria bacterium]